MRLHVFQFVEGSEQTHLDGSVLLGIAERTSVRFGPGGDDLVRKKNTDRVGQLAVGGDVEDVLVSVGIITVGLMPAGCRGRTFSDEVVLVNVALGSGVRFQAADRHGAVAGRWSLVVREVGGRAISGKFAGVTTKSTEISAQTWINI